MQSRFLFRIFCYLYLTTLNAEVRISSLVCPCYWSLHPVFNAIVVASLWKRTFFGEEVRFYYVVDATMLFWINWNAVKMVIACFCYAKVKVKLLVFVQLLFAQYQKTLLLLNLIQILTQESRCSLLIFKLHGQT